MRTHKSTYPIIGWFTSRPFGQATNSSLEDVNAPCDFNILSSSNRFLPYLVLPPSPFIYHYDFLHVS